MKAMMAIATAAALATIGMIEGVAHADPVAASCEARQALVYFAPGSADLNAFSNKIIDRIAADAKACGRAQVAVDAPEGALKLRRMTAIAGAFAADGVNIIIARAPPAASKVAYAASETMIDRTATLRLMPAAPTT